MLLVAAILIIFCWCSQGIKLYPGQK